MEGGGGGVEDERACKREGEGAGEGARRWHWIGWFGEERWVFGLGDEVSLRVGASARLGLLEIGAGGLCLERCVQAVSQIPRLLARVTVPSQKGALASPRLCSAW